MGGGQRRTAEGRGWRIHGRRHRDAAGPAEARLPQPVRGEDGLRRFGAYKATGCGLRTGVFEVCREAGPQPDPLWEEAMAVML